MITRRAPVALFAVVLVIAVLAVTRGGGGQRATDAGSSHVLPAHAAPASAGAVPETRETPPPSSTSPQPRPATVAEDLDEAMPSPTQAPAVWDDQAAAAATAAATAALEAFARPDPAVDAAVWWQGLEPTLSSAAAPIYASVDPRLVPYTHLLQVQPAQRAGSDLLAEVTANTDAGSYDVLLSRENGASPWRVERLRPQEQP